MRTATFLSSCASSDSTQRNIDTTAPQLCTNPPPAHSPSPERARQSLQLEKKTPCYRQSICKHIYPWDSVDVRLYASLGTSPRTGWQLKLDSGSLALSSPAKPLDLQHGPAPPPPKKHKGKSGKQEKATLAARHAAICVKAYIPLRRVLYVPFNLAWMQFPDLSTIDALGQNARCLLSPLMQRTQLQNPTF